MEIPADVAGSAAVQHAAWMVLNMLARLDRVVSAVSISCPAAAPTRGRIVPFATTDGPLLQALQQGAATVGIDELPIDFAGRRHAIHLVLGPGAPVEAALRVHGEGWCGGFARSTSVPGDLDSALPVGPYLAAALAVGEVFKAVRMDPQRYDPTDAAFYSAWTHRTADVLQPEGPHSIEGVELAETLAGVGAVGCICAHTLWASPGVCGRILLVDGDPDGIDTTNLNRYLLFGPRHLGKPKASTARDLLQDSAITWGALDGKLETASRPQRRLLCAVDTNPARLAVQTCWPESLLMASTNELRAEIVRCDPRSGGPCASCFNHHDEATPDDELRRRFREASAQEQERLAAESGATLAEAQDWARRGTCGTSGDRVRDALREKADGRQRFAVPFASCAAGTLLAAEVIKEQLNAPAPLAPSLPRAVLQFWHPARSLGARPYHRDPSCPVCRPGTLAADTWRERTAGRPTRLDAGQ